MQRESNTKKTMLVILDGWGHGTNPTTSAISAASTPYVDSLYDNYPNAELITFGDQVGLPKGQMGNSEVGHLNIGAGRIVYQELLRINNAIKDGTFFENETLVSTLEFAKKTSKKVHLIGLLSDGGVHSHINHLKALCDFCTKKGVQKTYIHAFTDGRDCSPTKGVDYLQDLLTHIEDQPVELASIVGRYYAMDRDNRWERIKIAYDLLVKGKGQKTRDPITAIKASYQKGNMHTDEFLAPILLTDASGKIKATIQDDDIVIFFNYRTDRPRQLTQALSQTDFVEYDMKKLNLHFVTMTRYNTAYKNVTVVFDKDNIKNTIGEVLEKAGKTQLRIAETEKYPHVTFFFSGGREKPFDGEQRILIPSPKVATYDLQPEMSAKAITTSIIDTIKQQQPDFICLNYANTDMVGHTGSFEAAKVAATTVDQCLQELMNHALKYNYATIIIADHGNSDIMINPDGSPHTAHTTNMVPCIYVSKDSKVKTLNNGKLADVGPTILEILGIKKPIDMDGISLFPQEIIQK